MSEREKEQPSEPVAWEISTRVDGKLVYNLTRDPERAKGLALDGCTVRALAYFDPPTDHPSDAEDLQAAVKEDERLSREYWDGEFGAKAQQKE